MRSTVEQNSVVVCDGQRPMGAIIPRKGKYEAHLADGQILGKFDDVKSANRAIYEADKAKRGAA